jgi:hypothetical protein
MVPTPAKEHWFVPLNAKQGCVTSASPTPDTPE